MDVLSEVLRSHARGTVLLGRYDYRSPWAVQIDSGVAAGLHVVESGSCYLRVESEPAIHLQQGDVAVLPLGSPHVLADDPRRKGINISDFFAQPQEPSDGPITARVVCAAQNLDPDFALRHPLLHELPRVIHLSSATVQSCPYLSPCLRLLLHELNSDIPGRAAIVELLLETFLFYVVRQWIQEQAPDVGWVGALRDPGMARVLEAMHKSPQTHFTTAALSKTAGMSRATFARKFKNLIGQAPFAYLTRVRMLRAGSILRCTGYGLAAVADRVGYTSEFAFSRAFKRVMGLSPSRFRARADVATVSS